MEVRYQLRYSPARPLMQMSLTPRGQTLEDRTTNVKRSYPAAAATLTIPPHVVFRPAHALCARLS